ncbi:MAG: branched-chain amino acid ABC transporter permease, partial [Chloroflexi bacterium]|nr:branched-chain amino acid ABC transporter permease [Chloroflexota bacterium]
MLALGAILPLVLAGFASFLLAEIAMYAIVALGLNILTGYSGQISVGQGALLGVGAYACAILVVKAGWPYPAAVLGAGAVTGLFGVVLGIPAVRLSGPYLAGSTLVLAISLPELLLKFKDLSGGSIGLQLDQPHPPVPGLTQNQWYAYLAMAVAAVMFAIAAAIVRGRVGRAWQALRDNEIAAAMMGVNVRVYKVLAFGLSAVYAGIGGAVYVIIVGSVAPGSFGLLLSILLLAMIVIGGLASLSGSILGAAFLTLLPLWSQGLASHAPPSIQ